MPELEREFVEYVVRNLVNNPEAVEVRRSVDDMGILLELSVDPEDMGKVIGRSGNTAKSLRTLLRVLASKNNERVNLKIIEPEGWRDNPDGEEHPAPADEADSVEAPEAAAPEGPDEAELITRTKQEFADLDDLEL